MGNEDLGAAILLLVLGGLILWLVIAIHVAILRWIFRINTIVANQEALIAEVKKANQKANGKNQTCFTAEDAEGAEKGLFPDSGKMV